MIPDRGGTFCESLLLATASDALVVFITGEIKRLAGGAMGRVDAGVKQALTAYDDAVAAFSPGMLTWSTCGSSCKRAVSSKSV